MLFKLLIGFDKLSLPEFLAKAQGIKVSLTSEPALTLFPDPWPTTYPARAQITTGYTEFETAFDAAQNGGTMEMNIRDQKRAALTKLLKDLAPYLEAVAKTANDPTMLNATGYDVRQPIAPVPQPLPAPTLTLRRGTLSGVLIANASPRPKGASMFETQLCTGDPAVEANWSGSVKTTACVHIELPGLTPGQLYHVRTRAHGSAGNGAWSDVASLMAA